MAMTADTDEWIVTLIRAPIVHIHIYPGQSLSGRIASPTGRVHLVGCSNRRRGVAH